MPRGMWHCRCTSAQPPPLRTVRSLLGARVPSAALSAQRRGVDTLGGSVAVCACPDDVPCREVQCSAQLTRTHRNQGRTLLGPGPAQVRCRIRCLDHSHRTLQARIEVEKTRGVGLLCSMLSACYAAAKLCLRWAYAPRYCPAVSIPPSCRNCSYRM